MSDLERAFEISEEPPTSVDAQRCLTQYYRELGQRFESGFNPDYEAAPSLDEFLPPEGTFLVMRIDDEAIGCGGLKLLSPGKAYIKRMWISPATRGLGLGKALLGALECKARAIGYHTICLETHQSLGEAQQLYHRSGYRVVEPFNDELYAHHWFEKRL